MPYTTSRGSFLLSILVSAMETVLIAFRGFVDSVRTFFKAFFQRGRKEISRLLAVILPNYETQSRGYSFKRNVALCGALLFAAMGTIYAADPGDFIDTTSVESIFGSAEAIFSLLVLVGGFLSTYIPVLNKIESGTYRVLALAIALGVVFLTFGFSTSVIGLIVSYALTTSGYEILLKKAKSAVTGR